MTLEDIWDQYTDVFKDELGLLKGSTAKIYKEADATPCFFNARSVPYALCKKVEDELNQLQDLKIIEPVQFSDWAAPIVPVLQNDGTVRICRDYKIRINKAAKSDKYPILQITPITVCSVNDSLSGSCQLRLFSKELWKISCMVSPKFVCTLTIF